MMKKIAICMLAALGASSVYAGSLDVHGDIKVNGKTVINANGELTGSAGTTITLQDYTNSNGLKKTFKTTSINSDGSVNHGIRIEDHTVDGITKLSFITYDWNNQFIAAWVLDETYENPLKWNIKGYSANEDGSANGFGYFINQTERRWLGPEEPKTVPLSGVYIKQYQNIVNNCSSESEQTCEFGEPAYSNVTEVVTGLGKVSYKSGDHTYNDCFVAQYNNSSFMESGIWTAIQCKGVGIVKGWQLNNSMELETVEGSLKPASKSARSLEVQSLMVAPR